jgi:serine/threonine protein kinase
MMSTNRSTAVDLGLCYDASTGPLYTMCGSALWMSPEMISNKPHSYPVSNFIFCKLTQAKIDIWSFGITVLEMTNGDPPSYGNKMKVCISNY